MLTKSPPSSGMAFSFRAASEFEFFFAFVLVQRRRLAFNVIIAASRSARTVLRRRHHHSILLRRRRRPRRRDRIAFNLPAITLEGSTSAPSPSISSTRPTHPNHHRVDRGVLNWVSSSPFLSQFDVSRASFGMFFEHAVASRY